MNFLNLKQRPTSYGDNKNRPGRSYEQAEALKFWNSWKELLGKA